MCNEAWFMFPYTALLGFSVFIFICCFSFFCVDPPLVVRIKGCDSCLIGRKIRKKKDWIEYCQFVSMPHMFWIKPNKAIIWPVMNREQYFKLDNLKWIIIILVHHLKLHVSIGFLPGWNVTLLHTYSWPLNVQINGFKVMHVNVWTTEA